MGNMSSWKLSKLANKMTETLTLGWLFKNQNVPCPLGQAPLETRNSAVPWAAGGSELLPGCVQLCRPWDPQDLEPCSPNKTSPWGGKESHSSCPSLWLPPGLSPWLSLAGLDSCLHLSFQEVRPVSCDVACLTAVCISVACENQWSSQALVTHTPASCSPASVPRPWLIACSQVCFEVWAFAPPRQWGKGSVVLAMMFQAVMAEPQDLWRAEGWHHFQKKLEPWSCTAKT